MEISVNLIPKHNTQLIPVASENLEGKFSADIKTIVSKNKKYKVFDYYVYEKGENYPRALIKLATGVDLDSVDIWKKYPNSKIIFLFVCNEI